MSDLIDRQVAIDKLQKEINEWTPPFDDVMGAIRCGVRLARNIIEDLPSAQPERKRGKWIYHSNWESDGECGYECSECGMGSDVDYGYCMRCGARMDGEANE